MEKKCARCGETKTLGQFHKNKAAKDGHCEVCKICAIARTRQWYAENPERVRRWHLENPERLREHRKTWLKKNPEFRSQANKRYRTKHPQKIKAHMVLNYAVTSGKIIRPETCISCGAGGRIEGHHPDYSKPLEVIWVCVPCHKKIHQEA
jgi:hypothetical protein